MAYIGLCSVLHHVLIHIVSHLLAWKLKINALKMKKNRLFCFKLFQIYGSTIHFRSTSEFFWKIPILKNYHPEGAFAPRGKWDPLLKQKLNIDWIFLFQSKILNFAMIGFHQISLSTFIRNFALHSSVKKFEKFESFPKFSK